LHSLPDVGKLYRLARPIGYKKAGKTRLIAKILRSYYDAFRRLKSARIPTPKTTNVAGSGTTVTSSAGAEFTEEYENETPPSWLIRPGQRIAESPNIQV
jgi:hypothetical protein